jgi:CheY-like chemotaxis protein
MRPAGVTAVASVRTSAAPPTARLPRCTRCQSFEKPSTLEYSHIGETTMRLASVSDRMVKGSKRCAIPLGYPAQPQPPSFFAFHVRGAHDSCVRVLVVEDEAAVRHLIDRVLTRRGHHVLMAERPELADAILLDFQAAPDVAVLDVILPGKSGVTYATELEQQFPAIRVVFITGWHHGPFVEDAKARGTLLTKPFTPADLLDLIGP